MTQSSTSYRRLEWPKNKFRPEQVSLCELCDLSDLCDLCASVFPCFFL
jgi:hypothetical protein